MQPCYNKYLKVPGPKYKLLKSSGTYIQITYKLGDLDTSYLKLRHVIKIEGPNYKLLTTLET